MTFVEFMSIAHHNMRKRIFHRIRLTFWVRIWTPQYSILNAFIKFHCLFHPISIDFLINCPRSFHLNICKYSIVSISVSLLVRSISCCTNAFALLYGKLHPFQKFYWVLVVCLISIQEIDTQTSKWNKQKKIKYKQSG